MSAAGNTVALEFEAPFRDGPGNLVPLEFAPLTAPPEETLLEGAGLVEASSSTSATGQLAVPHGTGVVAATSHLAALASTSARNGVVGATSSAQGAALRAQVSGAGIVAATSAASGAALLSRHVAPGLVAASSVALGAALAGVSVGTGTTHALSQVAATSRILHGVGTGDIAAQSGVQGASTLYRLSAPGLVTAGAGLLGAALLGRFTVPGVVAASASAQGAALLGRSRGEGALAATSALAGQGVAAHSLGAGQVAASAWATGEAVRGLFIAQGDALARAELVPERILVFSEVAGQVGGAALTQGQSITGSGVGEGFVLAYTLVYGMAAYRWSDPLVEGHAAVSGESLLIVPSARAEMPGAGALLPALTVTYPRVDGIVAGAGALDAAAARGYACSPGYIGGYALVAGAGQRFVPAGAGNVNADSGLVAFPGNGRWVSSGRVTAASRLISPRHASAGVAQSDKEPASEVVSEGILLRFDAHADLRGAGAALAHSFVNPILRAPVIDGWSASAIGASRLGWGYSPGSAVASSVVHGHGLRVDTHAAGAIRAASEARGDSGRALASVGLCAGRGILVGDAEHLVKYDGEAWGAAALSGFAELFDLRRGEGDIDALSCIEGDAMLHSPATSVLSGEALLAAHALMWKTSRGDARSASHARGIGSPGVVGQCPGRSRLEGAARRRFSTLPPMPPGERVVARTPPVEVWARRQHG
jgi:hypothetical protein